VGKIADPRPSASALLTGRRQKHLAIDWSQNHIDPLGKTSPRVDWCFYKCIHFLGFNFSLCRGYSKTYKKVYSVLINAKLYMKSNATKERSLSLIISEIRT
jgi:hypothetical protein